VDAALKRTDVYIFAESPELGASAVSFRHQLAADAQRISKLTGRSDCVVTEFPPVVLLYSLRVARLPPWREWTDISPPLRSPCRYYYAIPAYLAEPDVDVLLRLGSRILFQSGGYNLERPEEQGGIFFDLTPDPRAR
jgi:hypothetical protein